MSTTPLLSLRDLSVHFDGPEGSVRAVDGVDLDLHAGECIGIVGESGSGKTQLLLSMAGLSSASARIGGSLRHAGEELPGADAQRWRSLRGRHVGMVFQDPMQALNPFLTIGTQLTEALRARLQLSAREARGRALHWLEMVHIDEPALRLRQYPHELSGGMRQRVLLAMALSLEPAVLLCDEPTTALDVTVQAQILELLRDLRARTGIAVVLVTHDLAVVAQLAERVYVMYAGRMVETAPVAQLFAAPAHPYTAGLLQSTLRIAGPVPARLACIEGDPPVAADLQRGCAFAARCRYVQSRCHTAIPLLRELAAGHLRACHLDQPPGRAA